MKFTQLILTLAFLTLFNSCGHIFTKSDTYDTSSSAMINGAKISTGVKPMGGNGGISFSAMVYMAGSAKLEGPFLWRIEAEGKNGIHTTMLIHRIKVETSKTNRKEWFDAKKLGVRTRFRLYKKEPEKVFAIFKVPGQLKVFPEKDGDITIYADVTVTSKLKSERKMVKFKLAAQQGKKEREFLFIPAEIVNSFGQQDPREWEF